jgi:hypothetical protein
MFMSELEIFANKIKEETINQRKRIVTKSSTSNEMIEYLNENSLVDLLVKSIHWFNNDSFDKFLITQELEKYNLEKIDSETNASALQIACFLCLPKTALQLVEKCPEMIGKFSKNDYSAISTAILNSFINLQMAEVVDKMLDYPQYCNFNVIHNFNSNVKSYIWQYACRNGIDFILKKMYSSCIGYFDLMGSTEIATCNPIMDLIENEIESVAISMIKEHRDKCLLDRVFGEKTVLMYALTKNSKDVVLEILTNYDDCNFEFKHRSGLTAFELLIAYGYQGVIFDILENNRKLYHNKFIHNQAKTPFELALYQKNWDLAGTLVAFKFVEIEEIKNTKVSGIPVNQYLLMNNEIDLLKYFLFIENKSTQKLSDNENEKGWQKIKELGLETIVKEILKDPTAFTQAAKDGKISITKNNLNPSGNNITITEPNKSQIKQPIKIEVKSEPKSVIKPKTKSKPEPETQIETKTEPKKRGRPRKIKPEE